MKTFVDRHASKIVGALSCFDRVVITGTLPDICHAEAMAGHLGARGIRLFDYPQFAMRFRGEISTHAEELAHHNGLAIDFIRRNNFRKEERIKAIVAERGDHSGLADSLDIRRLHRYLDRIAAEFCPPSSHFPSGYHWSLMQVEYATDVVFQRQADFQPLYDATTHTAIHAIEPEHVATCLGRKLTGSYEGEAGNDFHTRAATHRYLDFLAAIDDPSTGLHSLEKISTPVRHGDRSYCGFNLLDVAVLGLFRAMTRGEFTISGFQARTLRPCLPGVSPSQLSRMLKRLRTHGIIKKIGRRYKYYLTTLGRTVATAGLKLRELVIIPTLSQLLPN